MAENYVRVVQRVCETVVRSRTGRIKGLSGGGDGEKNWRREVGDGSARQ